MTDRPAATAADLSPDQPPSAPPADCQFCGCPDLDRARYLARRGPGHAWCRGCRRMSIPVTREACWGATALLRELGHRAASWDPLADAVEAIAAGTQTTPSTPAALLATRALTRSGRDRRAAGALLREWMELVPSSR